MKHLLASLLLIISFASPAYSQLYQWTWMSGEPTPGELDRRSEKPVYPLTNDEPLPRIYHSLWVDKDDNLWVFGGYDVSNSSLNDLWRYDTHTNKWTLIKGDSKAGQKSVYGLKGQPTPEAMPGGRGQCGSWVDTTGNLWLFGGQEIERTPNSRVIKIFYRNDLWMFDVKLNQWRWVSGDTTETSDKASVLSPQGRSFTNLWTGNNGDIYIFGGYAGDSILNDFWRYTQVKNTFTLLSGISTPLPGTVYGTKGKFSSTNKPGARQAGATWADREGNLWLYGGAYNNDLYRDMWEYDVKLGQWAWISGDSAAFNTVRVLDPTRVWLPPSPKVFGSLGISSVANTPGGRSEAVSFKDEVGNFWLFGGFGSSSYSDVWKYDRTINQWAWMKGDSSGFDAGNYGIRGTANEKNRPGDRYKMAGDRDSKGNFWMFGGEARSPKGYGYFNDLWKLSIRKQD